MFRAHLTLIVITSKGQNMPLGRKGLVHFLLCRHHCFKSDACRYRKPVKGAQQWSDDKVGDKVNTSNLKGTLFIF